jgi:hypothetical protein
VHVAAAAEILAGSGDHHSVNVVDVLKREKSVGELSVGLESEWILSLRPIERDRGNAIRNVPGEMAGFERRRGDRGSHMTSPPAIGRAIPVTALASGEHNQHTAFATSSGVIMDPLGMVRTSIPRADSRLVLNTIARLLTDSSVRSVSV